MDTSTGETRSSNPSPSEENVTELVPRPEDMAEVIQLSGRVARLEQDLELARLQLRDAWARVPYDPSVLKRPYQSDIAITCRACGKPTRWRTARGIAEHMPECPSTLAVRRESISADVFSILQGLDTDDENLDDD